MIYRFSLALILIFAAAPLQAQHSLKMSVHETSLSIEKGTFGDPCGIFIGLTLRPTILPGNDLLLIDPLVLVSLGTFDRANEYHFYFGHLLP